MRLLIIAALVAALPMAAEARWDNMTIEGMQPSDWDMISATSPDLEDLAVGEEVSWNNPASGNSGIIRLLKESTYQEMPCQYRGHIINIQKTGETTKLVFRNCKTPEGVWKLAPE